MCHGCQHASRDTSQTHQCRDNFDGDDTSTTAKTRNLVSGLKKQSSNHGKAFHQQTVSNNHKVHLRQLSRKTISKFIQNVSRTPFTLYSIVVFLIHRSF